MIVYKNTGSTVVHYSDHKGVCFAWEEITLFKIISLSNCTS